MSYVQVYTGNGKGKTTAAVGLAIRSAGAGGKVMIIQFMKDKPYSEEVILRQLPQIEVVKTGKPFFIAEDGMLSDEERKQWGDDIVVFPKGKPPADYVRLLENGMDEAVIAAESGKYDLLILDEINVALFFRLISVERVMELLKNRSQRTEIVLTGRNAPAELIEQADLVTEMKEIRHYYQRGIEAREGVEY